MSNRSLRTTVGLWTSLMGLLLLCGTASAQPSFDNPIPEAKPLSPEQRIQVEAWRRQYRYVSLADRLAYENAHRNDPAPKLSAESERHLHSKEQAGPTIRAQSLAMLHSDQVERFVANQGLGFRRMIVPAPDYLPSRPDPQAIPFARVTPLSAEETAQAPTRLLNNDQPLPTATNASLLKLLPTRAEVANLHAGSLFWFLPADAFGHAKSRAEVAGFVPHSFSEAPKLTYENWRLPKVEPGADYGPEFSRWQIARLELVSLLKYGEPRVYESKHLPRMDELRDAPTRAVTKFESEALAALRDGEHMQTSSTINRIEMLGAIRADKTCLECHEVPRGTLLGAFSYELRRDPPPARKPQTGSVQ